MRRRSAASLLVLVALVAVVAVALVPRGLVRVTAAQHLPPAPVTEGVEVGATADDFHLPGVRAVVGKEEDGAGPLLTGSPGYLAIATPPAPGDARRTSELAAPPAARAPAAGPASGRAPPRMV